MSDFPHPKFAKPDHPILAVLSKRWSPYVFGAMSVMEADLVSLFEAARWAASSYNEQPWRFILATKRNSDDYEKMLSCLVEANQAWAQTAPVLVIGCYQESFSRNGKPNGCAAHDLGLAIGNMSAEATARDLAVHPMAGIVPDRVRELYGVPAGVVPLVALAIGYPAPPDEIPENLREQELSTRTRKPLAEFVFGQAWGQGAKVFG